MPEIMKANVNSRLGNTPARSSYVTTGLLTSRKESFIVHNQKGRYANASILHEVPRQEGNEGCQEHNYEKWQASNSGCMPRMWDQDVQDRKELRLTLLVLGFIVSLDISIAGISSLSIAACTNWTIVHR